MSNIMQKTTSEIEPYIDRGLYDKTLQELRAQNNPALLVGCRNPYTGNVIRTEADADLYLQQQALSTTYRTAANIAIARQAGGYEGRIKVLEDRITTLEKKRRRPWLALLLVVAAFFAGSRFTQQPTRSNLSRGTSSYVVQVTATPKTTAKPKATATPKPNTANYKTKPRSGYSLERTVYVSDSGGKIHLRSNCSGMKYYKTMTYGEACERGYDHCQKCFG